MKVARRSVSPLPVSSQGGGEDSDPCSGSPQGGGAGSRGAAQPVALAPGSTPVAAPAVSTLPRPPLKIAGAIIDTTRCLDTGADALQSLEETQSGPRDMNTAGLDAMLAAMSKCAGGHTITDGDVERCVMGNAPMSAFSSSAIGALRIATVRDSVFCFEQAIGRSMTSQDRVCCV